MSDAPLDALQAWFARAVTSGHDERAHVDTHVARGARMTPAAQLAIYQEGYAARLEECLADDYPVLAYALGTRDEGAFPALVRRYVEAHPSRSPNLNRFGRSMAAFLDADSTPLPVDRRFAVDLARLEWAMVEAIHAPGDARVLPEVLATIAQDAWPGVTLRAATTTALLRFAYPVNAFFQAFQEDRAPEIPPAPEATAVAIVRRDLTVWRFDLGGPKAALLEALLAGETLEASLGGAVAGLGPEQVGEVASQVMGWFRGWIEDGFFAALQLPGAPGANEAPAGLGGE